jgi:hypothetical protein
MEVVYFARYRYTLGPPPGDATHWTGRMLAKAAGVSLRSVQRLLEAHQLVECQRVEIGVMPGPGQKSRRPELRCLVSQTEPSSCAKASSRASLARMVRLAVVFPMPSIETMSEI